MSHSVLISVLVLSQYMIETSTKLSVKINVYYNFKLSFRTKVKMRCEAEGFSFPEFSWQTPNTNNFTKPSKNSHSLFVEDFHQAKNAGRYTCMVQEAFGTEKHRASNTIEIYPPHNITLHKYTFGQQAENWNISVACKAEGAPIPTYKWQRVEDGKIFHGMNYRDINILPFLPFYNKYSGTYICIASSRIGGKIFKESAGMVLGSSYMAATSKQGTPGTIMTVVIVVIVFLIPCTGLWIACYFLVKKMKKDRNEMIGLTSQYDFHSFQESVIIGKRKDVTTKEEALKEIRKLQNAEGQKQKTKDDTTCDPDKTKEKSNNEQP